MNYFGMWNVKEGTNVRKLKLKIKQIICIDNLNQIQAVKVNKLN
jgi:hypothetical protein